MGGDRIIMKHTRFFFYFDLWSMFVNFKMDHNVLMVVDSVYERWKLHMRIFIINIFPWVAFFYHMTFTFGFDLRL